MIELRVVRRRSHDTRSSHEKILQFRTKDRHVESSTTTPRPLAWSEWKDVPEIDEDDE